LSDRSFTEFSQQEIKAIHGLSQKYNSLKSEDHALALLSLMEKHVPEIRELYKNGDPHFLTETGDLAVLCFELMEEAGKSPDSVMAICYKRYREKLAELIKNAEQKEGVR